MRRKVSRILNHHAITLGWTESMRRRFKKLWHTIPRPKRHKELLHIQELTEEASQ